MRRPDRRAHERDAGSPRRQPAAGLDEPPGRHRARAWEPPDDRAGDSPTDDGGDRGLLDDLGDVLEDLDRSMRFLLAVRDRARGALARWERFDAARVVQSCCTLEGRVLKDRVSLELEGSFEPLYLLGDPNALYDALVELTQSPVVEQFASARNSNARSRC